MSPASTECDLTVPPLDPDVHYASWPDILGRAFRPGDVVAVGVTVGRCASLTIGMVRRINRANAQGERFVRRRWVAGKWTEQPSCTVTLAPLVDSENRLGRRSGRDSIVDPDKVVRLDVSVADVLARQDEEPTAIGAPPG